MIVEDLLGRGIRGYTGDGMGDMRAISSATGIWEGAALSGSRQAGVCGW